MQADEDVGKVAQVSFTSFYLQHSRHPIPFIQRYLPAVVCLLPYLTYTLPPVMH
jgi:hypothetical protein